MLWMHASGSWDDYINYIHVLACALAHAWSCVPRAPCSVLPSWGARRQVLLLSNIVAASARSIGGAVRKHSFLRRKYFFRPLQTEMDGKNIFSSDPLSTDCPLRAQLGQGRVLTNCTNISRRILYTPKGCRLSCYVTLGCLWPFSYENYHYFILKKNDIGTEKKPQITLELVHSLKCLVPTMYLRSGAAVRGTHARRAHDLLNLDVRPTKFSTRSTFFFWMWILLWSNFTYCVVVHIQQKVYLPLGHRPAH